VRPRGCHDGAETASAEKSLVSQQIASFDEFVQNTMQELVDENAELVLEQALQHTGKDSDVQRRYKLQFGQIFLSKPSMVEADGSPTPMVPNDARLRNLTSVGAAPDRD